MAKNTKRPQAPKTPDTPDAPEKKAQLDLWEMRRPGRSRRRRPAVKKAQSVAPASAESPLTPPRSVWTVSQVIQRALAALEGAFGTVWVEGEISNCRRSPSGHLYFTLRDGACGLSGVMFRSAARALKTAPENGQQVRCRGRITIYPAQGRFQIIVDWMEPAGLGALLAELERRKAKLAAEGLFAPERKQPLPPYPWVVGVVTSPSGAAFRDIVQVLRRRWPARLILSPAVVQGEAAPASITTALDRIESHPDVAVIICGRGGGSMEDLAAFNSETVARRIAACRLPVISAVGHEVDTTLSDLAADVRAATPSAAAELVAPRREDVRDHLRGRCNRLHTHLRGRLETARMQLLRLQNRLGDPSRRLARLQQDIDALLARALRAAGVSLRTRRQRTHALAETLRRAHPRTRLQRKQAVLHDLRDRLARSFTSCIRQHQKHLQVLARTLATQTTAVLSTRQQRFARLQGELQALDPHAVLHRGYAIVTTTDGRAVKHHEQVNPGQAVDVTLDRGGLTCRVENTHPHKRHP